MEMDGAVYGSAPDLYQEEEVEAEKNEQIIQIGN